jgi:hypothetical protein
MEHLHGPVVRAVVPVLQNMDAHHQSNGFAVTAHGTVVNRQGFVKAVPIDQTASSQKLMLRIEDIRKQGLEHKKLPLWNFCYNINDLYQISGDNATHFNNFLQFSKSRFSIYAAYKLHFSG